MYFEKEKVLYDPGSRSELRILGEIEMSGADLGLPESEPFHGLNFMYWMFSGREIITLRPDLSTRGEATGVLDSIRYGASEKSVLVLKEDASFEFRRIVDSSDSDEHPYGDLLSKFRDAAVDIS